MLCAALLPLLLAQSVSVPAPSGPVEVPLFAGGFTPSVGAGHWSFDLTGSARAYRLRQAPSAEGDLQIGARIKYFVTDHLLMGGGLQTGFCSGANCNVGLSPSGHLSGWLKVAPPLFASGGVDLGISWSHPIRGAVTNPLTVLVEPFVGFDVFLLPWLALKPALVGTFATDGGTQSRLGLRCGLEFFL